MNTSRIMGIDYGAVRIGIAMSDPLGIIAQELCTINKTQNVFQELDRIIQEYRPAKIIIGMPFNLKGEKGQKAIEVENFIDELKKRTEIEIISLDERFTSKIAQQTLHQMNVKKKSRKNKSKVDSVAAALILQNYLDRKQS